MNTEGTASPEFAALQSAVAGRYSLERELGRGGMGIVYLARDVALDRPVAIKLLPPALTANEDNRARFLREARVAAGLSHPNIVPIHLVEERDGLVYFVMAYVQGETLGQRVRRGGPLPPAEAVRILQEVAWALAYAHGRGVVHRDVKPDNVLIEWGTGRALVADFGVARVASAATVTGLGEVIGTVQYMSPEQADPAGTVDGRSDLYSLGVTAFFVLTGRVPFEAATAVATLAMALVEPAPLVGQVRPDLPPALAAAVDRCLLKDPAARFSNGEALAEALGQAVAAAVSVPFRIRRFFSDVNMVGFQFVTLLIAFIWLAALLPAHAGLIGATLGVIAAISVALGVGSVRTLVQEGFGPSDVAAAYRALAGEQHKADSDLTARELGRLPPWLRRPLGWVASSVAGRHVSLVGRLLEGPFVRAIFRMMGIGLRRPGVAAIPATAEPAELRLLREADALLGDLPSPLRRRLGEVRYVVRRLGRDAERLRLRERELTAAVASVETVGGDAALGERRAALLAELEDARRANSARLQAAVAAFENLRLDLLRLKAGMGTPDDLTASLSAARHVGEDVDALLAGVSEVRRLAPDGG